MMPDHFLDNKTQELLAKFRIKVGLLREFAQPLDLALFARGIGRGQSNLGLVLTHGLRDAKALSQHVNDRGVDIVDALAIGIEHRIASAGRGGVLLGRCLRFMRHMTQN